MIGIVLLLTVGAIVLTVFGCLAYDILFVNNGPKTQQEITYSLTHSLKG